ncbi:MAG: bifunctional riboflavin kinase/FAD synthetase [Syntrophomonas sp.]
MEVVRELDNFSGSDKPLYLALGNFDGVHRGHQKLFHELVHKAKSGQGIAAAFIFDPHPIKILRPDKAPKLLATPERQAQLFSEAGIELLIYATFNREISCWSPEEFVEKILVNRLNTKEAFVGFNYSFGYKGAGTPDYLKKLGEKHGFGVNIIPPVEINGEVVSSSLIRQALERGDIVYAREMLGYYPLISGRVIEGEHRGATIGFPTANLGVGADFNVPGKGVYAARAVLNDRCYKAAINIGNKPTFHDEYPTSIEAHLIDFEQQIYGEELSLFFIEKIRNEKKFDSFQELVEQIKLDREKVIDLVSLNC